jgi:sugar lactone lactonase YvrE
VLRCWTLLLACTPLFGQQYTISTVAANTPTGPLLHNPTSVAADSAGNVYFSDWSGSIRKIWARDHAITTIAGSGILGYGGDGGQAIAAMLGKGIAISLDDAGENLYVADADNHRIRRVDLFTGIIATVAGTGADADSGDGGPAIRAGVSRPTGITVDSAGDLYFSSSWSRVRKLDVRTGTIQTVAGQLATSFGGDNGPALDALFWDPLPFAFQRTGDLYIADYENSRIRLIAAKTGIVTTVAGGGACTTSPLFNTLVCQGGYGGDFGPARNAALNHAQAVAVDDAGDLCIADTINHRIRRVDAATGFIYTIAGTGVSGFSGDGGLASAAQISFPVSIAVDPSGRVYFADEGNHRIRMLTPVIPRSHQLEQPQRRH